MFLNILETSVYELPKLFPVLGPLLDWLVQNMGSIGFAVVIFTLIIKTALLPLDYWSRAGMKKNQLKLEKMRPQLEKLQKQYANDKMLYNQKMQALYKKEGYSMVGACVPTLVTMVVFILIFNAFNGYLKYNMISAYNELYAAFQSVGEDPVKWAAVAQQHLDKLAPSFLWVKNIWVADVPWDKALMSAGKFSQAAGITLDANVYNQLVAPFTTELSKVNGFLVLPILSAGSSFLMQYVMSKTQKTQMELQGQAGTNKMMLIMMPIMMGVFAVGWTTAFAIYLVTSSLYGFLTTLIINKIVDVRFRKQEAEYMEKNRIKR